MRHEEDVYLVRVDFELGERGVEGLCEVGELWRGEGGVVYVDGQMLGGEHGAL